MQPKLEANYAVSLLSNEVDRLNDLRNWGNWTGWQRWQWPANVIRPGLRLYGADLRNKPNRLCTLLEVIQGGSFTYRTRREFRAGVKKLIGWGRLNEDPHWNQLPFEKRSPCTGVAMKFNVISTDVDIQLPGRFPQLGWLKLVDNPTFSVLEHDSADLYEEGQRTLVSHIAAERNSALRAAAKSYWRFQQKGRLNCTVCGFDFFAYYGKHGEDFIEMHHLEPVAAAGVKQKRPKDLIPVCSNCHRMFHRKPGTVLSVSQLRNMISTEKLTKLRA